MNLVRRMIPALAVTAALAAAPLAAVPAQAAEGTCGPTPVTRTFQAPASDVGTAFETAVSSLCPGDTLLVPPGTYRTGYLRFVKNWPYHGGIRPGTAALPITIASQDPANPALIQGGLQFTGADYWRILNLRVQATVKDLSALYMNNGVGWVVSDSEFWGARETNARANVAIAGSGGQPRGFVFTRNRVHDAADSTRADTTDHNIYVTYAGSSSTGGTISRNVIWNAPNGAGIKIGNGGAYNALGPWGVKVDMNTFFNNGRQILLHGNVSYNRFHGNLMVKATQTFVSDSRTTQIYVHDVTGVRNSFSYNYAYGSTMFSYDIKKRGTYGTTNRLFNTSTRNPRLTTLGTKVLWPSNTLAQPHGSYGTRVWGW